MKIIGISLTAIIAIFAFIIGVSFFGLWMTGYFAPKYEGIRRDVMIESRAYSEASIRRLYDIRREWQSATANGRKTLEATARHEFSIFPQDRMPADLQAFYQSIK